MSAFEIFSDIIQIAEVLAEVKKSLHKTHDVSSAIMEIEEKALAPVKDICKKISKLLHLHIGHGEEKLSELEGALNLNGAKKLLDKHAQLIEKGK
jgi:hypothetical protein